MSPSKRDVPVGSLDLLVLKAVSLTPMHGWGITNRIEQLTDGVLQVNPGALYPALERLQRRHWISAEWQTTENNRRGKYYRLTPLGEEQLGVEAASWRRMVAAVETVLRTS